MRLLFKLFLSVVLLVGTAQAHAQATPFSLWDAAKATFTGATTSTDTSDGGAFFAELERIATIAQSKFTSAVTDTMYGAGMAVGTGLIPTALAIGGSLALLFFMYQILMTMGESSNSSMINALFETAIPFIVAALLIKGYATYMDSFKSFLSVLSSAGTDPVSGMTNFYGGALVLLKESIIMAIKNVSAAQGFGPTVMAIVDLIGVLIIAIPILFFVLVGVAEVFGLMLLGPFLHAIAAAFGPIFIAGLVTPWTKQYFGTWLSFLVGSAVVTGVVRVGLQIASGVFESVNATTLVSDAPVAAALGVVAVMLMAVNSVISQIPGIASAMVPGNIGARSPTQGMIAGGKAAMKSNPVPRAMKGATGKVFGGGTKVVSSAVGGGKAFVSRQVQAQKAGTSGAARGPGGPNP